MNTGQLTNPLAKAAIEALNARDRQAWFALFASGDATGATLTDDGDVRDLTEWSDSELFGASKSYLMSIDWVEDNGLTVYGKFHSAGCWSGGRVKHRPVDWSPGDASNFSVQYGCY